ncbi:MAG: aminotransferase class IV [Desulfobacteraceae bacterium]|nr:aminotransferase class IV [Desulfobacteraceae bacterium]
MSIPILSFDQVIDYLLASRQPYYEKYLAMYSSWYGGIVTDPALMMVPVDDHMVHRGDGVFEAFKCTRWNIYSLDRHLDRMQASLDGSQLSLPVSREGLIDIIRRTIRAGNCGDCLVRLLISRGPGSFSANPYDSIASQIYVVAFAYNGPPPSRYEKGVKLVTSRVPLKSEFFATVKNCNYLPNVLMVKEALDSGADFSVSIDERGFLAETATENVGIVTKNGEFLVPRFLRTLRGITVSRALQFAEQMEGSDLKSVVQADITREQALDATEVFVFGTSFDIFPVVEYDGRKIGDGAPGPIFKKLLQRFREDESSNTALLTPVN